jgi:hypothetical protein
MMKLTSVLICDCPALKIGSSKHFELVTATSSASRGERMQKVSLTCYRLFFGPTSVVE